MTEQTLTAATGAESESGGLSAPPEGDGTTEPKGNREARYRVERNEARTERDALAAQLLQLQTTELHRQAGELLAVPEDIELSGKALADYLTPEGWVDRKAVAEAAAAVIESRPGLAKTPKVSATDPTQSNWGNPGKQSPTFVDLLKR